MFLESISCISAGDQWDLALQMLSSMPEKRVRMNTITVNAVINVRTSIRCGDSEHCEFGYVVSFLMAKSDMEILMKDKNQLCSLLEACGDRWQLALLLFERMQSLEVQRFVNPMTI